MLYRVGTTKELPMLRNRLPERVYEEVLRGVAILDCEYGTQRAYLQSGGYSVIVENEEDVLLLKEIVDFDTHPCEWATVIGKGTGFLSALFLLNDDFSIMAYMPREVAPDAILRELEEEL